MSASPVILGPDGKTPLQPSPRSEMLAAARARMMASAYQAERFAHPSLANWNPGTYSGQSALSYGREFVASRIHDLARNDGWASAAVSRVVDETIGSGWTLNAQVNARTLGITQDEADEINDQIEALHEDYASNDPGFWCDAERQTNQAGILGLAMRHHFLDGEAAAHIVWRGEEGTGRPIAPTGYGTCIQVIDPVRISNPNGRMDSPTLQQGVEIDEWNAAVGYHVRRAHPGDTMMLQRDAWVWDYVPRDIGARPNFIHAFTKRRAGERRGISKLISVVRKHKQVADIDDLEMQAISINSALAAFVTSPYDLDEMVEAMDAGKVTDAMQSISSAQGEYYKALPLNFRNAQVNFLQPGEDVKLSAPEHPNSNFEAFFRQALRNIASAAGLTYEMLTMDWSNVNYSSARAALLVIYKSLNAVKDAFAAQFMAPWYGAWLEEVFDRRLIKLPPNAVSFEANRAGWCAAEWIGTGNGWIDPLREAEAAGVRMATGVSTLKSETADQGRDWKKNALQRARERKKLIALGLDPDPGQIETRSQTITEPPAQGNQVDKEVDGDEEETSSARHVRTSIVPQIRRRT